MKIITYDVESYLHDWIVVFKDFETGKYQVFVNDPDALKSSIDSRYIYIGFNSKHYDQYIIKAICCGFSPEEIKVLSDYIISGGQGWEYEPLRDQFFRFNNVDVRDDMYQGLSLKAIEGHLHMDIEETEVDFDINRPLTGEETRSVVMYCKHDVDATEEIVRLSEKNGQTDGIMFIRRILIRHSYRRKFSIFLRPSMTRIRQTRNCFPQR